MADYDTIDDGIELFIDEESDTENKLENIDENRINAENNETDYLVNKINDIDVKILKKYEELKLFLKDKLSHLDEAIYYIPNLFKFLILLKNKNYDFDLYDVEYVELLGSTCLHVLSSYWRDILNLKNCIENIYWDKINKLSEESVDLIDEKNKIYEKLSNSVIYKYKALNKILNKDQICKLIIFAGSEEKLIFLSGSMIKLLGSDIRKRFYENIDSYDYLKIHNNKNNEILRYGFLYNDYSIINCEPNIRNKFYRVFCNKVALAIKYDFNSKNKSDNEVIDYTNKLILSIESSRPKKNEIIEKKINIKIQEKSGKRGGRMKRLRKKLFGLTNQRIKENRIHFNGNDENDNLDLNSE